jgi:hypothetical protein
MLIGVKVEKIITPIDRTNQGWQMGVQTGGMNKAATMLTHGFTNANLMPIQKAQSSTS